ncbi:glycosyltransferase [Bacteroides congonensis]|uniref:glycosyltransferase n=1 Tax=Bacteroides congonensis TaxID=1871006 RepID=UPI00189A06F3|nr:glycosyltransferase [Bacteroides congonensis]
MQRIIFINLHTSWMLVRNSQVIYFRTSAALKHRYILDYLLDSDKYEVCNYITEHGFSLVPNDGGALNKFHCLRFWENKNILKKNGIDPKKVTILTKASDIRLDDIVILYNIMGKSNYEVAGDIKAFKALSMLHFHGRKTENACMEKADFQCYFNEVDLSKSSELFRKYYHVERPWVVIPFVFAERFKNMKPFKERQNKCFSTGTITYKEHEEFVSVYGDPCDQPARKFVKDYPDFFKDTVDCYSSDYLEDNIGKKYVDGENYFVRMYKKFYNLTHIGQQKKYFSFNMVEKFNDYKMHLLGEEILGVPGIGYVEGMACGSAYIGLDSPMYRDLGLIPGIHYIAYDGTKESLRKTIEFWQKSENQDELEKIAKRGCEFVRMNFCGEKVAKELMATLVSQKNNWLKEN